MSIPKLAVGQKVNVIYRNRRREAGVGEVVKIARKYATVAVEPHSGEIQYEIETGMEKSNGYAPGSQILTDEQVAEREQRSAALAVLREART
jgi:hypothetical protein